MKQLIRKMISDLREQVVKQVPEVGEFKIVFAGFENPDNSYRVSKWVLRVTQLSEKVDPTLRERYLELVAYDLYSPYLIESVVGFGDKEKIMERLNDEDALINTILDKMPKLARDLEDI